MPTVKVKNKPSKSMRSNTKLFLDVTHPSDETLRSAKINARGYIEGLLLNPIDGSGLLYGWVTIEQENIQLQFNISDGSSIPETDIMWRPRPDVFAAYPHSQILNDQPGFLAYLPPGTRDRCVSLIASNGWRIEKLASSEAARILSTNPWHAAQTLFGVQTEETLFAERCSRVDGRILSTLIKAQQLHIHRSRAMLEYVGEMPSNPQVSIIIPLFRRFDFLENQILEFTQDDFIRHNAEVIYVIDDPNIVGEVRSLARKMNALTDFPTLLVWNNQNGGFSFANNLGITKSRGNKLLFLNSDVVPIYPGWLEMLVETLASDSQIGAVGARLLSPNGGLQHNGMSFRYNDRLSIWTNDHPFMGIDPALLQKDTPHNVQALTGACLLIQRTALESIGGWDTGYLIGDFEDSDLCLALRSHRLNCFLDPRVTLTHLERQSFTTIGDSSIRTKIALFNAARHQKKWRAMIEELHRENAK